MERSGAKAAGRRKRTAANDIPEVTRPNGLLTEEELDAIRQAYLDGCRGEILIGLRGEERVVTMLLPAQPNHGSATDQLNRVTNELEKLGCNGFIHVQKVLLGAPKARAKQPAVKVEHRTGGSQVYTLLPMVGSGPPIRLRQMNGVPQRSTRFVWPRANGIGRFSHTCVG